MIIHSTSLNTMDKVIKIYGGTKWVKIEDRFLLCVGTHTAGETDGEEIHTLIIDKLPSHSHQYKRHSFDTK